MQRQHLPRYIIDRVLSHASAIDAYNVEMDRLGMFDPSGRHQAACRAEHADEMASAIAAIRTLYAKADRLGLYTDDIESDLGRQLPNIIF